MLGRFTDPNFCPALIYRTLNPELKIIWGKIIKFGVRGAQVDERGPPTVTKKDYNGFTPGPRSLPIPSQLNDIPEGPLFLTYSCFLQSVLSSTVVDSLLKALRHTFQRARIHTHFGSKLCGSIFLNFYNTSLFLCSFKAKHRIISLMF